MKWNKALVVLHTNIIPRQIRSVNFQDLLITVGCGRLAKYQMILIILIFNS